MPAAMKRLTPLVLFVAAGPLLTGCVERTISITSQPTGALVYLNDEEVGRTPLTVTHLFHGVYDVRMELEGHTPLWTKQATDAPWWEWPGPDLIAEMIPNNKLDQQWHFELQPVGDVDVDAIVERAGQLSQQLDGPRPAGD